MPSSTELLRQYAGDYKLFIDSSALLSDSADKFWNQILPILVKDKVKVIVPFSVYEELHKLAKSKDSGSSYDLQNRAKDTLEKIISFKQADFVDIIGSKNDCNLDNVFTSVFPQLISKYNLLLISNNNGVSKEVLALSKPKGNSHDIKVMRISRNGSLDPFNQVKASPSYASGASYSRKVVPVEERFAIRNVITKVDYEVEITQQPQEGDTVTAKSGSDTSSIKLINKLSSGGEGTVYYTDTEGVVAKIYHPNKVSSTTLEKLKLMCSKNINYEGICFPSALLYNNKDEFVGFLMPQAHGELLAMSVFNPMLLQKKFPKWKKADTVQLALSILDKINYMHDRNILLGDINPFNIFVESPTKVYFVDTDSYQIEGYPCPVCNVEYTAPEIQEKHFPDFLRTLGNERFAIATLLFKVMMLGKHPYSAKGGDVTSKNILNGNFAYTPDAREQGNIPDGNWLFIWSHLSRDIKQAFYDSFNKNGSHYAEHLRLNAYEWQERFKQYHKILTDGSMKAQDAMSLKLIPTRCKKVR